MSMKLETQVRELTRRVETLERELVGLRAAPKPVPAVLTPPKGLERFTTAAQGGVAQ